MAANKQAIDVFFRLDANSTIGTGHLKRALILAHALGTNYSCAFIFKDTPAEMSSNLLNGKFRSFYLGQTDEASGILAIMNETGIQKPLLILDGDQDIFYQAAFQQTLINNGVLLYSLTMYNKGHFYSHIVHNQNILALDQKYSCEDYTRLLLGPRYILLPPVFKTQAPSIKVRPRIETILLTFGGADPHNLTLNILEVLKDQLYELKSVRVVVGPLNDNLVEIRNFAKQHPQMPVEVFHNTSKMAELMAGSDVAITSGGLTTWELAYLGVPHCVVSSSEREADTARALDRLGVIMYIGHHSMETCKESVLICWRNIQDAEVRNKLSAKSRSLVDGEGLQRVCSEIEQLLKDGNGRR